MRDRSARSTPMAVAALFVASAAVGAAGGSGPGTELVPGPEPTVAFYHVPDCPVCARIHGWLDELEEAHPRMARVVRTPVTEPGISEEMHARGIEHHGVAIVDGAGEVAWAEQAHVMTRENLVRAFEHHVVDDRVIRRMEIACGSCIHGMEDVRGCKASVVVDGRPHLVTGVKVRAHGEGLCSAAKTARVAGHVEDGRFHATFVEIE